MMRVAFGAEREAYRPLVPARSSDMPEGGVGGTSDAAAPIGAASF